MKSKIIIKSFDFKKQFSTNIPKFKKDYYAILGVNKNSSIDEIKKAYRALAKKYHPDVNVNTQNNKEIAINLHKFRDIAEAYGVLGNSYTKHRYDLTLEADPSLVFNSNKLKQQQEANKVRDKSGNNFINPITQSNYAEHKKSIMDEIRKQNNVDKFGNFKGGIPKRNSGSTRGNSLGPSGSPFDEYEFNERNADSPLIKDNVTEDALNHKYFNNEKKMQNQRFRPYFNIEKKNPDEQYDNNPEYLTYSRFALTFFLLFGSFILAKKAYNFYRKLTFEEKTKNLNAYEVQSLGPIIIKREDFMFAGKKLLTKAEYSKWLDNDCQV